MKRGYDTGPRSGTVRGYDTRLRYGSTIRLMIRGTIRVNDTMVWGYGRELRYGVAIQGYDTGLRYRVTIWDYDTGFRYGVTVQAYDAGLWPGYGTGVRYGFTIQGYGIVYGAHRFRIGLVSIWDRFGIDAS